MKKLLFLLLIACSFQGFSQKYIMLLEANDRVWVTNPRGEQKSVNRNPQTLALLQNQAIAISGVTDNDPITLLNFNFVASNIPVQTTIQGLFNYLKLNVFMSAASGNTNAASPLSANSPTKGKQDSTIVELQKQTSIQLKLATKTKIDSLINVVNITNRKLDSLKIIEQAKTKPTDLQKVDSLSTRFSVRVTNPQVNQTIATAGFSKITDGTNNLLLKNATPVLTDYALPIRQVPIVSQTGAVTTTSTAYSTNSNTVVLANVRKMIVENLSTTTDATFISAGVTYTLGSKSAGNVNPSQRVFEAFYDQNSFKYSPIPNITVNALASNVVLTLIFAQ